MCTGEDIASAGRLSSVSVLGLVVV